MNALNVKRNGFSNFYCLQHLDRCRFNGVMNIGVLMRLVKKMSEKFNRVVIK